MESIGQTLRQTRESRGWTIDQVARETNISRQYLEALEEDHYEAFPAEPYILGFLRTYCDHLGLTAEEMINRYRTLRIQEQPAPLEALIKKPTEVPTKLIVTIVGVVVGVVILALLIPSVISLGRQLPQLMAKKASTPPPKTWELTADKKSLDERFYPGDTLVLDYSGKTYSFLVKDLGAQLELTENGKDYKLRLGDTLFLDLDNNAVQDVRFFLKDFTPGQPSKGAELDVERLGAVTPLASGNGDLGTEKLPTSAAGSAGMIIEKPIVLQQGDTAKPFSVDVLFQAPALFRYIVDGTMRQENYYSKGQTIHIDATKTAELYVSNAGAVTVQVNSTPLDLGSPGQVATKLIQWVKDPASGSLQLVANPLY